MSAIRTPGGDEIVDDGGPIGLALSGGGLKASLFHIGVLARLAELDLLRRIDVISATSGGALVAALYHLRLKRLLDADGDIGTERLIQLVAALERDFLRVAQTDLRTRLTESLVANLKRVSARHSSAVRFGDLLDQHMFRPIWNGDPDRPVEMRELAIHPRGDRAFNPATDNKKRYCKAPALIINATNLGTGRSWRFDAERMGEPTATPVARRLGKSPLLAQGLYRRLPETYAGMTLGHAVAASMAAPDMLEPVRLHRLFPDPDHPSAYLDVRLADGELADTLGTDALLERGCVRLIVSDASGIEARGWGARARGTNDRARAHQLETLDVQRPGGVVLIHLLSEIEALEVKPLGPIERGSVVKDRHDADVTSYGVERGLQKLIASIRVDLDAPSDIEAMSLMADGYLIAKRAFQRLRQRGQSWAEETLPNASPWRFTAMVDVLAKPSRKVSRHLKSARHSTFKAPRLAIGQAFGICLLTLAAALTLVALGAMWSALRPAAGADGLWIAVTSGLLALAAWLVGRHVGDDMRAGSEPARTKAMFAWIGKVRTLASALPLVFVAQFRHRANRAFLKAGRLKKLGIKPIKVERPQKDAARRRAPAAEPERKAA